MRPGYNAAGLPGPDHWANIAWMSQATSLYLAPVESEAVPDIPTIRRLLSDLDIIADELGPSTYRAGDGFSRHVIYAGCAPYLLMQPPQDGSLNFCHVALHGPFRHARLVTGPNTVKPRCPLCRARFEDWRSRLADWQHDHATAVCAGCGQSFRPSQLDWRGHAVSGRVLVELRNVFPGEASPSDRLMQRLANETGGDWQYAWAGHLDPTAST